jgi:hypothetical protein
MKIAPSELSAGPAPESPSNASCSFESIDKLRAEHTQLLKAYYNSGIDQFEELFTLCDDNIKRQAFGRCLVSLLQESERHVHYRDDEERL